MFSPGRMGLVAALNCGIARAEAPLIARMDADDIMHPARLERQRDFLVRRRNVALVGCRVKLFPSSVIRAGYREYVRWQNACISVEDIADNIYVESPFAHPSVMVRRSVFDKLGGYADGEFPEDYDMWLRMHRAGYRMAKLEDVLLYWRDRPGRLSRVDRRYAREAFDRVRAEYLSEDGRLQGQRPVVIWGAGRRTRQRARLLIDRGVVPVAWVDIDPRKIGHTVWGHPVQPPDWLAECRPRPFVLVYVTRHGARDEVSQYLESGGVPPGSRLPGGRVMKGRSATTHYSAHWLLDSGLSGFVMGAVVGSAWQDPQKNHPEHETPDVGPPGHPPGRSVGNTERTGPLKELHDEPEPQNDDRGDFYDLYEEEQRHERQNLRPRVEQQVCTEDSGDRSAGADAGDFDVGIDCRVDSAGAESCQKVEERKTPVAQAILHVIAENPQVPHVSDQMQPSAVQEHRCKEWQGDPY